MNSLADDLLVHTMSFLCQEDVIQIQKVNHIFNKCAAKHFRLRGLIYDSRYHLQYLSNIHIHKDTNFELFLKSSLYQFCTCLVMPMKFCEPILLPNKIKKFVMGKHFNQPIVLPTSLEYLNIAENYKHALTLPDNLKTLVMGWRDMNLYYNYSHDEICVLSVPQLRTQDSMNDWLKTRIHPKSELTIESFFENASDCMKLPSKLQILVVCRKCKERYSSESLMQPQKICSKFFMLDQ